MHNTEKLKPSALQLACPEERRYGKKSEQRGDADRHGYEPVGDVPGPRSQSCIEPSKRQNAKNGAGHFVKQLLEDAPEAAKSSSLDLHRGAAHGCSHRNILAHNREQDVLRAMLGKAQNCAKMSVNVLETRARTWLVSKGT